MSQMRESVGTLQTGSRRADAGSGIRIMSLSWIFWKPRMLEPSKPMPSSQMDVWMSSSSVNSRGGIEKCCQSPGKSLNFRSTIWMPLSLTNLATSSGFTGGRPPPHNVGRSPLYNHLSPLASPDPDGVLYGDDEDLAVTDVAGPGGVRDEVDRLGGVDVLHDHLDLQFGQHVDGVRLAAAAAVDDALLGPAAGHVDDVQADEAARLQGALHVVQLLRADDRFDLLHAVAPPRKLRPMGRLLSMLGLDSGTRRAPPPPATRPAGASPPPRSRTRARHAGTRRGRRPLRRPSRAAPSSCRAP